MTDLRSITTPIEDCVSFVLGSIDPHVIAVLEERWYDQAPVVEANGNPVGILDIRAASALLAQSMPLGSTDPAIGHKSIKADASVEELLEILSNADAVLVEDEIGRVYGLLTVSDLNRHRFRSVLYGTLAELEALLARMVDLTFTNPWDWLEKLNEDAQVRLIGSWHLAQRRNVDTGPLAGCTLTELLKVIVAFDVLRTAVGFRSRAQFDRTFGSLPDLRNRVMHPVRPLILSRADVKALDQTMEALSALTVKVREYLITREAGSRVGWL